MSWKCDYGNKHRDEQMMWTRGQSPAPPPTEGFKHFGGEQIRRALKNTIFTRSGSRYRTKFIDAKKNNSLVFANDNLRLANDNGEVAAEALVSAAA